MATKFNWFRPGYELVTGKFEWMVQVPFLQNPNGDGGYLKSPFVPTPDTPNSKLNLQVHDTGKKIVIFVAHHNSVGKAEAFVEPALVKMSILNKKGAKFFKQMLSSIPDIDLKSSRSDVQFILSKEQLIESKCQQSDGSLTFCWKIYTHVKREPTSSSADPSVSTVDCTGGLSTHFEELFNSMQISDVILNIRGREFPAHKVILAARSKYFAAMFEHPMKEQSTNQIEIEDIKPEVFQELLRFIYTGRISTAKMKTMAAGLFIAADKYLLDDLKMKCENYLPPSHVADKGRRLLDGKK
jgi:speckle-type POZ protein